MYSRKFIRASMSAPPAMPRGVREVSPPPDYTGMAFSGDRRQDYPETLIPERSAPAEEFFETVATESAGEPVTEMSQGETFLFDPLPEVQSEEQRIPLSDEEEPPPEPLLAEAISGETETVSSPAAAVETEDTPPETKTSPPAKETAETPLLTLSLLKSLTLEDLLLFWMLLMLLVSNQEDQIYLLLGLLLFSR